MLTKIHLYSNFGLLSPNIALDFAHRLNIPSIAKFSVSGSPEIENTVDIGENQYIIRIQQPKIII